MTSGENTSAVAASQSATKCHLSTSRPTVSTGFQEEVEAIFAQAQLPVLI